MGRSVDSLLYYSTGKELMCEGSEGEGRRRKGGRKDVMKVEGDGNGGRDKRNRWRRNV